MAAAAAAAFPWDRRRVLFQWHHHGHSVLALLPFENKTKGEKNHLYKSLRAHQLVTICWPAVVFFFLKNIVGY